MRRMFIGGLGRSGTTIALHALHRHPTIYAVPLETKFLVEEDGFADLIHAMTTGFSIAGASAAHDRFEDLMRRQVPGLVDGKFRQQHTVSSDVFPGYDDAVDRFLALLQRRRYFTDPAPLLAATRRFIAATFDTAASQSGRNAWVEKTPSNIWRSGFLRQLWPDCVLIHMIRRPRAILLSLMERGWLPAPPLAALTIFDGYMTRLLQVRRERLGDPGFLEFRLEDLVADTGAALQHWTAMLRLAAYDPATVGDLAGVIADYYRRKKTGLPALSPAELELIDETLRPASIELGYDEEGSG